MRIQNRLCDILAMILAFGPTTTSMVSRLAHVTTRGAENQLWYLRRHGFIEVTYRTRGFRLGEMNRYDLTAAGRDMLVARAVRVHEQTVQDVVRLRKRASRQRIRTQRKAA